MTNMLASVVYIKGRKVFVELSPLKNDFQQTHTKEKQREGEKLGFNLSSFYVITSSDSDSDSGWWVVLGGDIRGFNNSALICRYIQQRIKEDYYDCAPATHKSPNTTDHHLLCLCDEHILLRVYFIKRSRSLCTLNAQLPLHLCSVLFWESTYVEPGKWQRRPTTPPQHRSAVVQWSAHKAVVIYLSDVFSYRLPPQACCCR